MDLTSLFKSPLYKDDYELLLNIVVGNALASFTTNIIAELEDRGVNSSVSCEAIFEALKKYPEYRKSFDEGMERIGAR